jgi:hypothetical protein
VSFNILYRFLRAQVFTPSTRFAMGVYFAKDRRRYQPEVYNIMHQVSGGRWIQNIQNIAVDGFVRRVYRNVSYCAMFVITCLYI